MKMTRSCAYMENVSCAKRKFTFFDCKIVSVLKCRGLALDEITKTVPEMKKKCTND